MKAFTAILLCVGTLAVARGAPARGSSPQRSEYNYEGFDNTAQAAAQEPQESASHYDAYIEDVKAAASGGGGDTKKKGFSQGSGLRTIAIGSANQAKTALGNQQAAAYQAAYVAKNTLAQSAAQASATAQAALAGKQVLLSGLEQQVRDAKTGLQGEEMQLQQAKRAAQAAAQAAQQAMHQVNVIQAALNAAQATSENANEAASQAAGELGAQTAMVGAARQRLHTLQEQLHGVRIDFEATQAAARKAQAAAQQAQANAAEAAAKAAAAGLALKDAHHEESSGHVQRQPPPKAKIISDASNLHKSSEHPIKFQNSPQPKASKLIVLELSPDPKIRYQPVLDNFNSPTKSNVEYSQVQPNNLEPAEQNEVVQLLDIHSALEKFPDLESFAKAQKLSANTKHSNDNQPGFYKW